MGIVLSKGRRCQDVPGERGIVVGVDVSKGRMDFVAVGREGRTEGRQVRQDRKGFEELGRFLWGLRREGYEVWVAFEPTGPYSSCLREWLRASAYRAVQVNPYHVKRTKEVRDNSPRKSDRKDPLVIADLVWQGCYQEIMKVEGIYAELRSASANWPFDCAQGRSSLCRQGTRLRNEFQGLMEAWFPELGGLFVDKVCKTIRAIVRRHQDTGAIARARHSSLRWLVRKASRGTVSPGKAEQIRSLAGDSISLLSGQRERWRHMCRILDMLEQVEGWQNEVKGRMKELLAHLPEAQHLLSIPYVGVITVAGLLGECGDLRNYRNHRSLEKFVGLNLYEVSSGQHQGKRHISKRGRHLARYLLCQGAVLQMRRGGLYYHYRVSQMAKKQHPNQIRVAIARKLLTLLYAIARDRKPFDEHRFVTEQRLALSEAKRAGDDQVIHQGAQAKAA